MNNLKNVLYRLKFAFRTLGSADEMEVRPGQIQGIGGWQNHPTFQNLGLWVADKFSQHHGSGSNTPISLNRLMNDATIIFPDLDNPDVIEEYVDWVKNISTCYKNPGEGNVTEVLFGYEGTKFWMCLNGLATGGECAGAERNEVPILLPRGADRSQVVVVNLADKTMVSNSSPYKVEDFWDKSIAQIRAMICQMHFKLPDDKPWNQASEEEKQDARYSFVQAWLNRTVNHIESSFTGIQLNGMGYMYTGPGVGVDISGWNVLAQGLFSTGIICAAVTQYIVAGWVNLAANTVNSFEEFQYRRVRELLKMQALMYFTLLLNSNVCDELSGEERVKCRCGIKKRPAPPPQPEPGFNPIGELLFTDRSFFWPFKRS
jgi:hypothetical protein